MSSVKRKCSLVNIILVLIVALPWASWNRDSFLSMRLLERVPNVTDWVLNWKWTKIWWFQIQVKPWQKGRLCLGIPSVLNTILNYSGRLAKTSASTWTRRLRISLKNTGKSSCEARRENPFISTMKMTLGASEMWKCPLKVFWPILNAGITKPIAISLEIKCGCTWRNWRVRRVTGFVWTPKRFRCKSTKSTSGN